MKALIYQYRSVKGDTKRPCQSFLWTMDGRKKSEKFLHCIFVLFMEDLQADAKYIILKLPSQF